MAEREAAQVAARRARDEAAAKMELDKAKEALAKQQRVAAKQAAAVVPKPPVETKSSFGSVFGGVKKPAPPAPVAKAPVAKETPKKAEAKGMLQCRDQNLRNINAHISSSFCFYPQP